jgi:hypothetical protein
MDGHQYKFLDPPCFYTRSVQRPGRCQTVSPTNFGVMYPQYVTRYVCHSSVNEFRRSTCYNCLRFLNFFDLIKLTKVTDKHTDIDGEKLV